MSKWGFVVVFILGYGTRVSIGTISENRRHEMYSNCLRAEIKRDVESTPRRTLGFGEGCLNKLDRTPLESVLLYEPNYNSNVEKLYILAKISLRK